MPSPSMEAGHLPGSERLRANMPALYPTRWSRRRARDHFQAHSTVMETGCLVEGSVGQLEAGTGPMEILWTLDW